MSSEFIVQCPTCLARLRVGSAKAAGAIWPCPKCGSMVAIPRLPSEPTASSDGLASAGILTEVRSQPTSADDTDDGRRPGQVETGTAADVADKHPEVPGPGQTEDREQGLVKQEGRESDGSLGGTQPSATQDAVASSESVQPDAAAAPSRKLGRIAIGVFLLLSLALGVWFWYTGRKDAEVVEPVAPDKPDVTSSANLDTGSKLDVGDKRDELWVPNEAGFFIYEDLSVKRGQTYSGIFTDLFSVGAALSWANDAILALGIKHEVIAKIMLSGDQQFVPSVAVLKLKEHQRADQLNATGQSWESVGPLNLRRIGTGRERLAFVVLDANRVVIGREDAVKRICSGERFTDLERILAEKAKDNPATLAMVRPATFDSRSPLWWFDPWPQLDHMWRELWNQTDVFITVLRHENKESLLLFEWFAKDAKARDSLEKNIRGLLEGLIQYSEAMASGKDVLEWTSANGASGKERDRNIATVWLASIKGARVGNSDTSVTLTLTLGGHDDLDKFLQESAATVLNLWQRSAQAALAGRQSRLGTAMSQYEGTGQIFPAAAGGGVLLPPETRLSWIANLLPYLGHEDWAKSLQVGYSWNSAQNRPVTQRYLPEVINPLLGPTQTLGGYFDSHFVGVTGVGKDSGELPPTHPRAGVFNFQHPVRRSDIKDGLSNTIAVLGAEKQLGPWAAGGTATARGLATPPYVSGADGFGSAMPQGMLAIMADGSVRFIRKDIDPRVLEQLATIAGGEPVTVDLLEPTGQIAKETVAGSGEKNEAGIGAAQVDIPLMQVWCDPCGPGAEAKLNDNASIDDSLRHRLSHVRFRTSLALALVLLTQWSGVPLSVDPESAQWAHLTGQEVVQIDMQDVSFEDLAKSIAAQVGLSVMTCQQSAILVVPDRASKHVRYELTVGDRETGTLPSIETLGLICDWLNKSVGENPERMTHVAKNDDQLVIEGPFGVVFEIKKMLEMACGPDSSNDRDDESEQAAVSLNFFEPTRLIDVAIAINRVAKDKVFFDWTSLAGAGVTPDAEVSISASGEPLPDVLKRLAASIQSDVHRLADGAFLVCAPNRFSPGVLRLYRVGNILDQGMTPGNLRERIVKECVPESWGDSGGKGTLVYDASARAFVVLNSDAVHRELGLWLQKLSEDRRGR